MSLQIVKVTENDDDIRLDRWFKRHYPHISKGLVDKLCRKGALRINGKRCKAADHVHVQDEIKIPHAVSNAEMLSAPLKEKTNLPHAADIKLMEKNIIHEDRFILVVNKPAGLASQGGSGIARSLDEIMKAIGEKKGYKTHLVHRLDKDTSGLIIMAKTPAMATKLTEGFKRHDIRKIYLALIKGHPRPHEGEIDLPLRKSGAQGQQKVHVDYEKGQKAISQYQVLEHCGQEFSLCALSPLTGRTHQLRVHMAEALNCPIIGDKKYGGLEALPKGLSPKLHLHAWRLEFRHPKTEEPMTIEAPLPETFQKTLQILDMPIKSWLD